MKVAYLINQYPKVSHSFIRREIQALERRGLEIARFSVRPPDNLADAADKEVEAIDMCLQLAPDRLAAMGEAGRQRVADLHAIDRAVDPLAGLFARGRLS